MALLYPLIAAAVPPPPELATADCEAPTYASDQLVCGDAELLALDRLLAAQIAGRGAQDDSYIGDEDDLEWFRRSRRCASETDHRDCLLAAYCLRLVLVGTLGADAMAPCNPVTSDYLPAASFSRSGFAQAGAGVEAVQGQRVRIWGFVDHGNIYGDTAAREILGEWWSGEGSTADSWRFNLKAAAADPPGASFAIQVPNDLLRDDLLRVFAADARNKQATRVFLQGQLEIFDAPTQGARLTGLRLELVSSRDIRLDRPGSE